MDIFAKFPPPYPEIGDQEFEEGKQWNEDDDREDFGIPFWARDENDRFCWGRGRTGGNGRGHAHL